MTAVALTQSKDLWYVMRATGMVSVILLTLTMIGGIVNVKRFATPKWPRFVTFVLHRNVALLAVGFLAAHIGTAVIDTKVPVGWQAAIVPFSAKWRPVWVGFGTLAFEVLAALVITSLLRTRMSRTAWRAVHWLAYACWPLALAHGFGAGTDRSTTWGVAVLVGSIVSLLAALGWRLVQTPSRRPIGVAARHST